MAGTWEPTKYPGIFMMRVQRRDKTGEAIKYRIKYYDPAGVRHNEVIGRSDDGTEMTAKKALGVKAAKEGGVQLPAVEQRVEDERKRKIGKQGKPTVRRLWEIYDEAKEERACRKTDAGTLIPHLEPLLDREAESLTTDDIEQLKKELYKTKRKVRQHGEDSFLTPQTVKHVLALLKRILRHASDKGLFTFPAGFKIELPKVSVFTKENLNDVQMSHYWDAIDNDHDRIGASYLALILMTALRKSAALKLKWSEIDLENKIIMLPADKAKKGEFDTIHIGEEVVELLRSIPRVKGSPWVFPSEDDPLKHREAFRRTAERIKRAAGLPDDFRPIYGLRHTFASHKVAAGVPLPVVARMLTNTVQAAQHYVYVNDPTLRYYEQMGKTSRPKKPECGAESKDQ